MDQLLAIPASRIQEMFGGSGERERTPSQRQIELEALLPQYAARLKRKSVTVKSLFEEYSLEHPDGFCHASFGVYIQRYRLVSRAVGHIVRPVYEGEQRIVLNFTKTIKEDQYAFLIFRRNEKVLHKRNSLHRQLSLRFVYVSLHKVY